MDIIQGKTDLVLGWIEANKLASGGISAWPGEKAYPEVTGYLIPTLLIYGREKLAKDLAEWLLTIQDKGGSFPGLDGLPRSFDTAAVLEGLDAAYKHFGDERFAQSAKKAKNWIVQNTVGEEGMIYSTPDKSEFRNYSLRVNGLLGLTPEWTTYRVPWWPFIDYRDRTHYIAYAIEGLIKLGDMQRVEEIIKNVKKAEVNGFIAYWVNPNWEPTGAFPDYNATAQIGLILASLGIQKELRGTLFRSLTGIIKHDGGLPTRPGSVSTSWTAKWFLDFAKALQT